MTSYDMDDVSNVVLIDRIDAEYVTDSVKMLGKRVLNRREFFNSPLMEPLGFSSVVCVDFYPSPQELDSLTCDVFVVNVPNPFYDITEAIKAVKDSPLRTDIIAGYFVDLEKIKHNGDLGYGGGLVLNDLDFTTLFFQEYAHKLCFIPELQKWQKFTPGKGWVDADAKTLFNYLSLLIDKVEKGVKRCIQTRVASSDNLDLAKKFVMSLRTSHKLQALKKLIIDVNAIPLDKFTKSKKLKFVDGVLCDGHHRAAAPGDLFFNKGVNALLSISEDESNDIFDYCASVGLFKSDLYDLQKFFYSVLFYDVPAVFCIRGAYNPFARTLICDIFKELEPYASSFYIESDSLGAKNVTRYLDKKVVLLEDFNKSKKCEEKAKDITNTLLGVDSISLPTGRMFNLSTNVVLMDSGKFVCPGYFLDLIKTNGGLVKDFTFRGLNSVSLVDAKRILPIILNRRYALREE